MKGTFSFCSLLAASLCCTPAILAEQVIEDEAGSGAQYRIVIPEEWNGDLVVYAHGFIDAAEPIHLPVKDEIGAIEELLTGSGYAVAYSSYSKNGLAVREGVKDTRDLHHLFIREFGKPDRTFLVGHSLGGLVSVKLAEDYPQHYNGVLTLAGMIGGSQAEIDYMANVRILFEYYYPGVLPGAIDDVPPGTDLYNEVVIPIAIAIQMNPVGAANISWMDQAPVPWNYLDPTNGPMELVNSYANAIGFWYRGFDDVMERTGNKGFYDNAELEYTSAILPPVIMDPVNDGVERFEGTRRAEQYFVRYAEPTGRLRIPHLAIHNSRDPVTPIFHQYLYAAAVAEQGDQDMLVQRVIDRYGHTDTFSADEVFEAFLELIDWVDSGMAPSP